MPLVLTQLSSGGYSLLGLIHSRADDVNDPVIQQGQYTAGENRRRILLENSPGFRHQFSGGYRYGQDIYRRYSGGSPGGRLLKRRCCQKYCSGTRRTAPSIKWLMRVASSIISPEGN